MAVVDANRRGIGVVVLAIPPAVPLADLVLLGAFIPIIGAGVAGGVAVLIALVAAGPIPALVIAGMVVAVMLPAGTSCRPSCSRVPCSCTRDRGLAIAAGLLVADIPGTPLGVALPVILNSGIRSLLGDADV